LGFVTKQQFRIFITASGHWLILNCRLSDRHSCHSCSFPQFWPEHDFALDSIPMRMRIFAANAEFVLGMHLCQNSDQAMDTVQVGARLPILKTLLIAPLSTSDHECDLTRRYRT
jgi:hypothetical protein